MSYSFYLNGLWDREKVAMQLLFRWTLFLRFVQNTILVYFPTRFFSKRFVKIEMVQYWHSNIFSEFLFYFIREISFPNGRLHVNSNPCFTLWHMNWSFNFRGLLFNEEIEPSCLKHMNSVLSVFMQWSIPLVTYPKQCSISLAWGIVFARSARSSALFVWVIVSAGYRLLLAVYSRKHFFHQMKGADCTQEKIDKRMETSNLSSFITFRKSF